MNLKIISGIVVLIIFFSSCKKESDNNHPIINIHSPSEFESFQVFDTILVKAEISDESPITSVKVVLTNSDFTPVLQAYYYNPNSTHFKLEMNYPISDYYLEDGNYYIQVSATDGANSKNKYHNISINGIPKMLKGVIAITKSNSNAMNVFSIDTNNNNQILFEINGDYASSVINSRGNQLYFAGKKTLNITAFNMLDHTIDWQLPPVINPPMHSDDCLYFDEYLFSTFSNDYIRAYNSSGGIYFTTDIDESALNQKIFRHNDLVLVDRQSKTNGSSFLISYYLVSGVEKQRRLSNFRIVEFMSYSQDEIFIACNEENEGRLLIYDPYLDVLTSVISLPGKIISAIQPEVGKIFLCTENQIFTYDYNTHLLSVISDISENSKLLYEPLNKQILLLELFQIKTFSYPGFELQNISVFEDTIMNAHLFYNK